MHLVQELNVGTVWRGKFFLALGHFVMHQGNNTEYVYIESYIYCSADDFDHDKDIW